MITVDCDSKSKTVLDSGHRSVIISSGSMSEKNGPWFVTNYNEMNVSKLEWKKSHIGSGARIGKSYLRNPCVFTDPCHFVHVSVIHRHQENVNAYYKHWSGLKLTTWKACDTDIIIPFPFCGVDIITGEVHPWRVTLILTRGSWTL